MVRLQREAERAQRAHIREAERQERIMLRDARTRERENLAAFLADREAETQKANNDLAEKITDLQQILSSRIGQDPGLDFKKLFEVADEGALDRIPGLQLPAKPDRESFLPKPPSILVRWFPLVKRGFHRRCDQAIQNFRAAQQAYDDIVQKRFDALQAMKRKAAEQNDAVLEFAKSYNLGSPTAVSAYFELILSASPYPSSFPSERKIAYVPESKQLVIEFELPTIDDAVPAADKFRYVKKTNEVLESKRSEKSRHLIYSNAISQAVLRCLYDIFYGDKQAVVETAVVNAHVSTTDRATGHPIHPCLVSVRTSRDRFLDLQLSRVEPILCLKELKASVSSQPGELLAVKPILELNMIDPRFVQESDILSSLDSRPNLMELSPSEFESLITNLFSKMGLDTKLTQPSRDGGVDCVAFDSRPILGGKVIIQAKRYKNTVGVSAVRDLFGTLHNEGASKGILVTTSGFGKAAYDFANGKPIELITGSNLLFLLKENAGVDAKIEAPPDWIDPHLQTA
jgi:restriction system protein